jgi:uncharacterized protein YukE
MQPGDIDNINKFRKPGDPGPEETKRIVDNIIHQGSFAIKHAPTSLRPTDMAVAKSKAIHLQVIREARGEIPDPERIPLDEPKWRGRLMRAYQANFEHHLTKEELVEVLSVIHTEIALGLLR